MARGENAVPSFLSDGGELGQLIAGFDWSRTTLGPVAQWPYVLCNTISLILSSTVPIVTLWGEDGVMIYNDAYSCFAGARHPQLLGSRVREGWPEVADFNDHVMGYASVTTGFTPASSQPASERTADPCGSPARAAPAPARWLGG